MKYPPKLLPALPLLAVVFFLPRISMAVPQTWLGSNGDYKVSSNWSGNVVPGSGTGELSALRGGGGYVVKPGDSLVSVTFSYDLD